MTFVQESNLQDETSVISPQFISDLLDFSRIQSGTFSLEPYAEALGNIILPVIDGMKTLAEAKQQTVEWHIESNLPEVAADGRRVGKFYGTC